MFKLKRILAILLCGILCTGILSACGGGTSVGKDTGKSGSTSPAAVGNTVTWWTWSTEATEAYKAQVELFKKAYPNINVELQFIANSDYWTKLPVAIAGGTGPDVYQMTRPSFELYAASNQAVDLTDAINKSDKLKTNLQQIDPAQVDTYKFNNKQMALPYTVEATAIAYNKNLFKAAGLPDLKEVEATWTWEDLRELANKLTIRDKSGEISQYGFFVAADRLPAWELIWSREAEMFNDAKDVCTIADPKIIGALQPLVDMCIKDKVSPIIDTSSTTINTMNGDDMFMSGKIAMIGAGIWKMPTYRKITSFEWDVVELPFDSKTGKRISSSNVLGFVVNPKTKAMDSSVKLLEVLTSPESQKILADTKTYIPANQSVRESYFDTKVPENIGAYKRAMAYLHPNTLTQYIPYAQFNEEFTGGLRDAFSGTKTLPEAMSEREQNINKVMSENKAAFNK